MDERDRLVQHLKVFFEENARRYGIEMVFLYGSWARGIPRWDSDIDIAVIFWKENDSEQEGFLHTTDISYNLSEELKREVNIIRIHFDFRNPMLYYNAIVLGIPLFVKDKNRYARVIMEAIYQMEDFSIFGLDWQYETARKNLEVLGNA